VSARRCGTSGTVPAEAVGSVQEAEEQMLFETCEEGLYSLARFILFIFLIQAAQKL